MSKSTQAFRPGFVIIKTSTARGGVRYDRRVVEHTQLDNGADEKRLVTDIKRDNADLIKESEALVKLGDYVLRQHCTDTVFGWFCDKANLSGLEAGFEDLRVKAERLNQRAQKLGSARRVHMGYVAAQLVLDEYAAREIASTIVEALKRFRDALTAGEVRDTKDANGKVIKRDQVRAAEIAHANLEHLAQGMARDQLKMAIESIRPQKAVVVAALKDGLSPEDAGAKADVGAIDNAIFFFEKSLLL